MKEKVLPDMCYVCVFGQGNICVSLEAMKGIYNNEDKAAEMYRRAGRGKCDDAREYEPWSLTTESNRGGLKAGQNGSWVWQKVIPADYEDLGVTGKRINGLGGNRARDIHSVKKRNNI